MHFRSLVIVLFGLALAACGSDGEQPSAPAATGGGSSAEVATAAPQPHPGEEVYENFCFSCHTPGLSGAPKLGDVDAWAPRIAKGPELLLTTTKEGIPPAMPAMGLCMRCTDEELNAAIDYMVQKSQ